MQNSQDNSSLLVSYLTLRQAIGILGIVLPLSILLYAFALSSCGGLETSISAYYHTGMRDVFVGILCVVGIFMVANQAFERPDRIASTFAGICAIGVAMFPTDGTITCGTQDAVTKLTGTVHYISASSLFLAFAYMSILRFTKSSHAKQHRTGRKKIRNAIYLACGWTIVACIAIILVHHLTTDTPNGWLPTFWLEAISLFAFGISWLVKGETILKDRPNTNVAGQSAEPAMAIAN